MTKRNFNFQMLVLVAIVLLMLGGIFYLIYNPDKKQIISAIEKSWPVSVTKAKIGTYSPEVTLYGKVESPQSTNLEATIAADVLVTPVKEGDFVKKGQLLVSLDDRETKIILQQRIGEVNDLKSQIESEIVRYNADKEALKHEENLAKLQKREVERLRSLFRQKVGSESALDTAEQKRREHMLMVTKRKFSISDHEHRLNQLKARLVKAEALKDRAELDLSRTKIYAPFDGRITDVDVSVGNRVQEGEVLIKLFDTNEVEVHAQIPLSYLAIIKNALNSKYNLQAKTNVDGKPIILRLERLAGFVEKGQGGVDGLFKIINDGRYLAKGRIITLNLKLPPEKNVVAIPVEALYDENLIYVMNSERMHAVKVHQVGRYTDKNGEQYVLVRNSKLKPNTQIITTHLPNARTGLKVDVVE